MILLGSSTTGLSSSTLYDKTVIGFCIPSSLIWCFVCSATSSFFAVDESGWLSVTKGLDYEMWPEIELTVRCQDSGGLFTDVSVLVTVIDENDNVPEFAAKQLNWTLVESGGRYGEVGDLARDR